MKSCYKLTTLMCCAIFITGCTYQKDNYFEIQPSPTIDQKVNKLTEDMKRLNRDVEELYGR